MRKEGTFGMKLGSNSLNVNNVNRIERLRLHLNSVCKNDINLNLTSC